MTRIDTRKRAKIMADYICAKRQLNDADEIAKFAVLVFYRLPGRKSDMNFTILVDLILRCVQLVERAWAWHHKGDIDIEPDVARLASALSERIYGYETPRQ
jgi:hypothetical protein